jgi:hypothetical protein
VDLLRRVSRVCFPYPLADLLRIQGAKALNISLWKMQLIKPPKDKEKLVRVFGIAMLTVVIIALSLDLLARRSGQ